MSFHKDLVNKIKSNKRDEVYILLKQIITLINLNLNNNEYFLKEFKQNHADMLLSFLADEKDLKLIPNHFNIILELYTINNWHLTISSYSLVIRILCNLMRFNEALDYLNDAERHNLIIKNRMISPFFETLKNKNNQIYYLESNESKETILDDFNVSRNELLILIDLFERYKKVMSIHEFNCLFLKIKEYLNYHDMNLTILDTRHSIDIHLIIKEIITEIIDIWINNDQIISRITLDLLIDLQNYSDLKGYKINQSELEKYTTIHTSSGLLCKNCNHPLKKHILEKDEKQILQTQLINSHPESQKVLGKFSKWLNEYIKKIKTKDIVYILDGGNIGHSLYQDFSIKAIFKIIENIKNKYKNENNKEPSSKSTDVDNDTKLHIILILHKRHKELLEKTILLEDDILSIYLTPPNHNDDLFWMLASLMFNNSFIITNDLLRDHHVNKLDETLFNRWKDTHLVSYDIHTNIFNYPKEYTIGFQTSNNGFHIPFVEDGKNNWMCLSIQ